VPEGNIVIGTHLRNRGEGGEGKGEKPKGRKVDREDGREGT